MSAFLPLFPPFYAGMIVKAKPLSKLCEYEGKSLPEDYRSDCWNDVDETEYACKEKKRILLKLKPPGSENAIDENFVPILKKGQYKIGKIEGEEDYEEEKARRPKNNEVD